MRRGPICLASTKTGGKCRRHVKKSGQRCPIHKTVSIDYFYGFYPYPEVWIGTKPEKELKDILGGDEDVKENALKIIRAAEKIYTSRNFELRICKDGLILFRMNSIDRKVLSFRDKVSRSLAGGWSDLYEAWNEYLLHLNLLSFLLASACAQRPAGPYYVFECREIQKFDVARITFENNEPKRSLWYGPELKSSAFRRGKIHSASDYEYDRPNIPVDIFDELFTQCEAVISTPNAATLLQPIMKAYFEYMAKNNHLALTLSWTAIEIHLFNKYRSYLETINQTFPDGSRRINAARKKHFLVKMFL